MKKRYNNLIFCLALLCALSGGLISGPAVCLGAERISPYQLIQERLRDRIETDYYEEPAICRGEVLCSVSMLPVFYQNRDYNLAWSNIYGPFRYAEEFLQHIKKAVEEGLRPTDYHLYSIGLLLEKIRRIQRNTYQFNLDDLIDLDFLLTDAFLLYCSHLSRGRVNAETIHIEWIPSNTPVDYAALLEKAINEASVVQILTDLSPSHAGYKRMKQALKRLREIERNGGWPLVGGHGTLKKGESNQHVVSLRKRLLISGDLPAPQVSDNKYFDDQLEEAVRKFQARHGIKVDGRVGLRTLEALNAGVAERRRQIEVNMERWRWIPHDLGSRYLLVNIADFKLQVVENLQNVMDMRVVVGKYQRKTPVFSDEMEYIVLNPYWYIPPTIAGEDILPEAAMDPEYFRKKNIKIFAGASNYQEEIDPYAIDWHSLSKNYLPYQFRQEPGKNNALGRIKFMFPNKFSIYLHDTPGKSLFLQNPRDFSSGCIRVEKPLELAAYLLRDDPVWSREKLLEAMESGDRRVILMTDKVLVYILYWTAWVDENNVIHFRNDIYDRDKRLDKVLQQRPPMP